MTTTPTGFVFVAGLADIRAAGCLAVQVGGHTVALCMDGDAVHAVDNRCPHMGFPLHRGTVRDGILTCHWHHARFDLATGGTFDQFADDVPSFPVEVRGDEVWVDISPRGDARAHARRRLAVGLERDLPLVIAKAALALTDGDQPPVDPFRVGLAFGVRYRRRGWGQGLTIHTCMANLLPHLDPAERPRALYHGLAAVAADTEGAPPRFPLDPLPNAPRDPALLRRWFRQFIEVRDAEGAERCLVSALAAGTTPRQVADTLFAAATDHRYIDGGHTLDFTNKALEALDLAGWEHAPAVLGSLSAGYADAFRMEEANAWRHPVDLVDLLAAAFERLPGAMEAGQVHGNGNTATEGELVEVLLGEDPAAIVATLVDALRSGAGAEDLAATVAYAAARRIAQFPESNEFTDWDTALHTFTFASAVHQGLRRAPSIELLRGVFDAAMSVYLDRFLNVPPARLPGSGGGEAGGTGDPNALLAPLPDLFNQQHRVAQAADAVARFLQDGGEPDRLLAMLGRLLLREDRNFHTIQAIEAAFRQYGTRRGTVEGSHILIAAARYLAAHAPTMRAQRQTYEIARRFARGEPLFEAEGG
jgi:nitrite reductase/ring-hydroxylating ferredoxin subunit